MAKITNIESGSESHQDCEKSIRAFYLGFFVRLVLYIPRVVCAGIFLPIADNDVGGKWATWSSVLCPVPIFGEVGWLVYATTIDGRKDVYDDETGSFARSSVDTAYILRNVFECISLAIGILVLGFAVRILKSTWKRRDESGGVYSTIITNLVIFGVYLSVVTIAALAEVNVYVDSSEDDYDKVGLFFMTILTIAGGWAGIFPADVYANDSVTIEYPISFIFAFIIMAIWAIFYIVLIIDGLHWAFTKKSYVFKYTLWPPIKFCMWWCCCKTVKTDDVM